MNDIFEFRNGLVENYKKFSTSFASPRSTDIASKVQSTYDEGRFWPDSLIQINLNYRKGAFIDELARQGNVEPETAQIFQTGKPTKVNELNEIGVALAKFISKERGDE